MAKKPRTLEGSNRENRPLLAFLAEMRKGATRLDPPDFLVRYDEERLNHIGRCIRAAPGL